MIERTLWYEERKEEIVLTQGDLKDKTQPLIVLGEAGMGKSQLLNWLCEDPRYALCSANQLINRHNPATLIQGADVLVIDALDEVAAQGDGDAVTRVLQQLGRAGSPRFVLSCRAADWRSATGVQAIREQYPLAPLELHLKPFSDDNAMAFLTQLLGETRAAEVIAHYTTRSLQGLLGNPQTLNMIAKVALSGDLPETKSGLFERSISTLAQEHNEMRAGKQTAFDEVLSASGAAFASLILSGADAVSRKARANLEQGELPLADVERLPRAEHVMAALGTRLFMVRAPDRFGYSHRSIAEFQAARWLAALADTPRKRRRLLALFHHQGLVPASLRGLHAWLAQDSQLAKAVIEADPMGVIEYGDADALSPTQARALLDSLIRLAAENPSFYRWGGYSLSGIARPELRKQLSDLICSPRQPFGLRAILLDAIAGTAVAATLAPELLTLMLDEQTAYGLRSNAAEALARSDIPQDWPAHVRTLAASSDEQSIRLALNLLHDVGYQAFEDATIAETVMAYARRQNRTLGLLYRTKKKLPAERAEGVLEYFLVMARASGGPRQRPGNREISKFAYHLIAIRLTLGQVDPLRLWSWIEPFAHQMVDGEESNNTVVEYLKANADGRRAIIHHVILSAKDENTIWEQHWSLCDASSGFHLSNTDIIDLLGALNPDDTTDARWQALLRIAHHEGQIGADVRSAARRFATGRPELLESINALANPPTPKWKIEREARERELDAERQSEWEQHRNEYAQNIDQLRAGEFGEVLQPAKAYLKEFFDMGDGLPAHERVEQWLGSTLAEAAHAGFEAFLTSGPTSPTAEEISDAYVDGERFNVGYVLIAAVAERQRNGVGLDDLSHERLFSCLFALRIQHIEDHTGLEGLEAFVEAEVRSRGLWARVMRMFFEPRLAAGKTAVEGLYELLHSDADADLATELAGEWLRKFTNLAIDAAAELIDHLLRRGAFDTLRAITRERSVFHDPGVARLWDAAGLIVDFDVNRERLSAVPIEPALIWALRDRTHPRFSDSFTLPLRSSQMAWIIAEFRPHWPYEGYPTGGSVGDENAWDATEYLSSLIRELGSDISDEAIEALQTLCNAPEDGYTFALRNVASEQSRNHAESNYTPPALDTLTAVFHDRAPTCGADLQVYLLEELSIVGDKVRGDDVDSWRGFYDDMGVPYDEERCRDHLVGLLREGANANEITYEVEAHVAADKEVDVACAVGTLRLPIEVKGQWHNHLWVAADRQLDRLYTPDWRADGHGIYLVLWFGDSVQENKALTSPGRGIQRPMTPEALRSQLIERSKAAQSGRVAIVVLDLSRVNGAKPL